MLPITKQRYNQDVEAFNEFARLYGFSFQTADQVDLAIIEFLDHLFLEGEDVAVGQRAVAAWAWANPEFSKHGSQPASSPTAPGAAL